MLQDTIKSCIEGLTDHPYIELAQRGNAAIQAALSLLPQGSAILIPEEGSWLAYRIIPSKLGLGFVEVECDDAKINVDDLKEKLRSSTPSALLYQNPGGYFAEQPMEEIYTLCQEHNCLVIMDVSGSIGTRLCNGHYADILVCSFGRWKLVDAQAGGFISFKHEKDHNNAKVFIKPLDDENPLTKIHQKLQHLQQRIAFLTKRREVIIKDLNESSLVRADDTGFVIIVRFTTDSEKENLINYCKDNGLEWTECPRSIRINKPAISIEVKRLWTQ